MSGDHSRVLVVIPCLNEAGHIGSLLTQMIAETRGSMIVVADGGSSDGTRAIVERVAASEPRVVLLDNAARIQSVGINLAVERFGGGKDWLLRIDAHCDYPKNYADTLLHAATEHGAQAVVVPMISQGTSCFQRAAAAAQNSAIGTGGSPHRHMGEGRFVDHGHHALIAIAQFRAAGGYREDMSHNEDAELDHRLGQGGVRIWLEPRAALGYRPRETPGSLWRQYWNYGKGRARTLRLHRVKPHLRQVLPLAVPGAMLLALIGPFYPFAFVPLVVWAASCLVAGTIIAARTGKKCEGLSGIAVMIMHVAWGWGFLVNITKRAK